MWKIGWVRYSLVRSKVFRQAVAGLEILDAEIAAEGPPDGLQRHRPRPFVEADADFGGADPAQVDFLGDRRLQDDALQLADIDGDRVEEDVGLDRVAELFEPHGQPHGLLVNALGDRLDALRTVEDRIHRRHDGQQHLRGADVGRRLFAADVLLARLQRQAVGAVAAASTDTPTRRPGIERL